MPNTVVNVLLCFCNQCSECNHSSQFLRHVRTHAPFDFHSLICICALLPNPHRPGGEAASNHAGKPRASRPALRGGAKGTTGLQQVESIRALQLVYAPLQLQLGGRSCHTSLNGPFVRPVLLSYPSRPLAHPSRKEAVVATRSAGFLCTSVSSQTDVALSARQWL